MQQQILDLCNRISNVTYENLTKIIRYSEAKSADGARKLDDSYENDLDAWMCGSGCATADGGTLWGSCHDI